MSEVCSGEQTFAQLRTGLSPLLGAQASRVSVYLSAFTFLSVVFIDFFASLLFCFLDKAGVFVGSSKVVPPVFPFFSPCLPCPFVFCFLSLPSSSSPSAFITNSFLLRICVYICLFCSFPFLFSGGFLVKKVVPLFNLCTGCQGVKIYF